MSTDGLPARGSSTAARIITAVIGLVATPFAIWLIYFGGQIWMQSFQSYGAQTPPADMLAGRIALQAIGLVLLVAVVLTGIWSSAGLITAGVLSIVPLVSALFPPAYLTYLRATPAALRSAVETFAYGHALILLVVLGAAGVALFLARRAPRGADGGVSVFGLILAPLVLALSAWLLPAGLAGGQLEFLRTMDEGIRPLSILAALAGVALLVAGVLLTRWSPWALILPAGFLLLGTALSWVPDVIRALPRDLLFVTLPLLVTGGGVAVAAVFVAHSFVIARVRRSAPPATPDAADPAAYPVAG